MANRLDIVIFGATGFTGQYSLSYVYKLAKSDGRELTWGIAGRSEQKLKAALVATAENIGVKDLSYIPILIADINDEDSIRRMTARARIIINCCGPFQLYGEIVVKSCIETGTHHLDITAEPLFLESIEKKYHTAARAKNLYIVSACGVDCIPADMGVVYLTNQFEGVLNSVDLYYYGYKDGEKPKGPIGHFGTWASFVNAMGSCWDHIKYYLNVSSILLPCLKPKVSQGLFLFPSKSSHKWGTIYPTADRLVSLRSQRYLFEEHQKRPIQLQCYALYDSLYIMFSLVFFIILAIILAQFSFGRKLLLQYHEFFSWGLCSQDKLKDEVLEACNLSLTLCGKGWSKQLAAGEKDNKTPPNLKMVTQISASNAGYGMTSTLLMLCAVIILTEPKKLPPRGGVYTTASAFANTSLIDQMQQNGISFKIISTEKL